MSKRIYVGNLPSTASRTQVQDLFSKYGKVSSVEIARDGTATIEMVSGGDSAIKALHQTDMGGRTINVKDIPLRR